MADALIGQCGFKRISSSGYLRAVAFERGLSDTRENLRQLGDLLDEQTEFSWLVNPVARDQIHSEPGQPSWFIDAVRKPEQVLHFRQNFPNVLHVHLTAPEAVLRERFSRRGRQGDDTETTGSYERFVTHLNEQAARSLGKIADLIIDLGRRSSEDAAVIIANRQ